MKIICLSIISFFMISCFEDQVDENPRIKNPSDKNLEFDSQYVSDFDQGNHLLDQYYRLFNSKIWMNIKGKADQFEYDFSIICQTILKTKNIGQCSVNYNARGYEDGKKCTWDVGIHAFKRIIFDKFNI